MTQNIYIKSNWSDAATAGLVLGCVSIAYMLVTSFLTSKAGSVKPLIAGLVSLLVWVAKFGGCIFLMKYYLATYAVNNTEAQKNDIIKFGVKIALTSALLYSAYYLVHVLYIAPDTFSDAIAQASSSYSSMMSEESLEALEGMEDKLPYISFFINLIYCTLFGTVLSAIIATNIQNKDPFFEVVEDGYDTDEEA